MSGEHLASFFMHFAQILGATSDNLTGRWSFDVLLDCLAFVSVPNYLEFSGRKMLVIVTVR